MEKNNPTAIIQEIPENFASLAEAGEFWDNHSTADYEQLMEPVEVEIDLDSDQSYLAIAQSLVEQIREHAHRQGVSTETLVNLWLQEKLYNLSHIAV